MIGLCTVFRHTTAGYMFYKDVFLIYKNSHYDTFFGKFRPNETPENDTFFFIVEE